MTTQQLMTTQHSLIALLEEPTKRLVQSYAQWVRDNPTNTSFVRMYYGIMSSESCCACCDKWAYFTWLFENEHMGGNHVELCKYHSQQCDVWESEILPANVISYRLEILGPHYGELHQSGDKIMCVGCYKTVHTSPFYGADDESYSGFMCSSCKQRSQLLIHNDVMRLLLSLEIIAVEDIRVLIIRTMLHYM